MPDPVQLAISALADKIKVEIGQLGGRCAKAWPDPAKDIPLPSAAVTHGEPDREGHNAVEISQTDVPSSAVNVDVAFEVADLTVPVQIDIWAATRTARGEIGAAIRDLFADPDGDDLRIELAEYHDRLATFQVERWRDTDDDDAAERQEFRQTIELTLEVPEVAVKRYPRLVTVDATIETFNSDEEME